jgi:ubiquitin thioesterase OTU1
MATPSLQPLKLKIRGPAGDKLIATGLTKNSTFDELRAIVARDCGVPVERQELSATYPPPVRVLSGSGSSTLAELKIQSNDVLLLKQLDPPAAAAPAASGSSTTAARRPTSPPKPKPASLESLAHLQPLKLIPIPNDNSCLFNSIGMLMEGAHSVDLMNQLRQIVASVILSDTENKYDEAFLGSKKEVYAEHMLKPDVWGGGIELSILAEYYNVEIAALDVETCHQYLFGTGDTQASYKSRRIYTVYSGVHYDALVDTVNGKHKYIFDATDTEAEKRALLAVRLLQKEGAFTNVHNFTLRCSICKTGFQGAAEAQAHAKETSHQQFEEYVK